MIVSIDEHFPSLRNIFAFRTKQCHSCQNYFKHERIWKAESLPVIDEAKQKYTEYYLCTGCAKTKKDAVKYFIELTRKLAANLA
jgi:hypothetical protein